MVLFRNPHHDFADEVMELIKNQILAQSTIAAQTNAISQNVLSLLAA